MDSVNALAFIGLRIWGVGINPVPYSGVMMGHWLIWAYTRVPPTPLYDARITMGNVNSTGIIEGWVSRPSMMTGQR